MLSSHFSRLNLLLVEDDADIREIVVLSLRLDPGVVAEVATNGATALSLLRKKADFDAILIDQHLPDTTGEDLAHTIRSLYDIPFLFLTAAVRLADKEHYAATGAIGVITKPFDPLSLAHDIRRLLAASTPLC